MNPIRAMILIGVVMLVAAACSEPEGPAAAIEANELVELGSVEELKERFNDDAGSPRLIVLLSPT